MELMSITLGIKLSMDCKLPHEGQFYICKKKFKKNTPPDLELHLFYVYTSL